MTESTESDKPRGERVKWLPWEYAAAVGAGVVLLVIFLRPWSSGDRREGIMADHYVARAQKLLGQGQTHRAAAELGKALGIDPAHHEAHRELGHLFKREGDLAAADTEYRAALQSREDAATYISLGLIALERTQNEQAAGYFRKAVDLDPDSIPGYVDLCIALLNSGEAAEALPPCLKAVELDPSNLNARHNLGFAYRLTAQHDKAIKILEQVLKESPDRTITLYELATSYADSGRIEEAKRTFQELLKLAPDHAEARKRLAALEE